MGDPESVHILPPRRLRCRVVRQAGIRDRRWQNVLKIRLLFEPKSAVYIPEWQWHAIQKFRTRRDCRVEMRIETTGRKELIRWVLSWMPDVKTPAPNILQDRIVEKLRNGLRAQE